MKLTKEMIDAIVERYPVEHYFESYGRLDKDGHRVCFPNHSCLYSYPKYIRNKLGSIISQSIELRIEINGSCLQVEYHEDLPKYFEYLVQRKIDKEKAARQERLERRFLEAIKIPTEQS